MKKGVLSSLVVVLLLATSVVAIGCPPVVEDRIVVTGSTSVYEVVVYLAERFMEKHPDIVVETHSIGSTAGIVGAHDGTADIGMSSRWLREGELGWGLGEFVICHDAIAPIVHPDNPVQGLTMEQLRKIFLGEITNWNEVGGKDLEITVIIREAGSGTRGAFEDIVHEDIYPDPDVILTGTGGVKAGVAGDPAAISYITIAAVDETVRALKVDGVEPTAAAVLAGEYEIARPFLLLTDGDPDPLEQKFIDFVLSPEGQDMLEDEGMVRVD